MKLLFVAPTLPYPPSRGYLSAAYQHIKHLSGWHTVDLISFASDEDTAPAVSVLSGWCRSIETVRLRSWRSILNAGLGLLADRPLQVSYYKSLGMEQAVCRRLMTGEYDVVIFLLTRMAQYRPSWYEGVTILNMVDPLILDYLRSLALRPWYTVPVLRTEITRLKRYEARQAPQFDRVLLVAQADVQDYGGFLGGAKLDWIPHGVDEEHFYPPIGETRRPGMIVITGNMFYAPNVDAVNYFCQEVFPLVHRRVPEAHLWVVGAKPTATVRRWARYPRIHVTGSVSDVRPYLSQAMVSVCPVRRRVGVQTKVLEALAMGTPVVATSAGNHGIGGIPGQHLHTADSPVEFAEKIVTLLLGERWAELSENGRRFVVENFAWTRSATRLEQILFEVVRERRGESEVSCASDRCR